MANQELEHFEMAAPAQWLQMVDDWRAKQPDVPSRAEAIRGLVEHALQAELKKQSRRERMDAWDADVARLDKAEEVRKQSIDFHKVEKNV